MPLLETKGAASAQGFGLTSAVAAAANYIEDVFQTWLYTGNGSTQTITNGVDLSGKGGLVWTKCRSNTYSHDLQDSSRGFTQELVSNTTAAQVTRVNSITSTSGTGYSVGTELSYNASSETFVSWTFREQLKFFDVVTYTGNGSNRTIAHNLGSVPGCIIVKRTDTSADWQVYHRSNANTEYMVLNSTAAKATGTTRWNSTTPTSTEFSLGTDTTVNASGGTYVAYLFAHDAGGFGASGTDNVISCGSYVGTGSLFDVTLGYEPQWIIIKNVSVAEDWYMYDTMRGYCVAPVTNNYLNANTSGAEAGGNLGRPTSTGFLAFGTSGQTYIYIAIRRGPMRTPTTGTSVFSPINSSGTAGTVYTTSFPVDLQIEGATGGWAYNSAVWDRLRKLPTDASTETAPRMSTALPDAEGGSASNRTFTNTGFTISTGMAAAAAIWNFRRAPGFFDVVCYTGTGSATTFSHNLGVVPEMMIVKRRSASDAWWVYDAATGNTKYQVLNSTATPTTSSTAWNNTTPTSSVFTVGTGTPVNASAGTYVAYLFATVAGVSKVGSYTGNGSSQTINCGFTGGARFVLIKRTDSTGDWYVWDSARGIVAGNDPHLSLNSTAAEVTTDDSVDTDSTGFVVNQVAATNVNVSSATYIFLAIA